MFWSIIHFKKEVIHIKEEVLFKRKVSIPSNCVMPLTFDEWNDGAKEIKKENWVAICIAIKGSCKINFSHKSCIMEEKDIVFLDMNKKYQFFAKESFSGNILVFDCRIFRNPSIFLLEYDALESIHQMMINGNKVSSDQKGYERLLDTIYSIWEETDKDDSATKLHIMSLFWKLASEMKQITENWSHGKGSLYEQQDQIRILPAIDYMNQNFNKKITVAELAKIVHMSVPNFNIIFREIVGVPPIEYLIDIRLQRAALLLQNSDRKVVDIAMECGFFSISNFCKSFRKSIGTSPSKYRMEHEIFNTKSRETTSKSL